MTNKEYRENWQGYRTFDFWDSLTPYEISELRKDVKRRGTVLDGTNWKASYRFDENGVTLTSYYTDVLRIDRNGNAVRLWDGWSATTARHINKFLALFNLAPISKREYVDLPLE